MMTEPISSKYEIVISGIGDVEFSCLGVGMALSILELYLLYGCVMYIATAIFWTINIMGWEWFS